MKRLSTAVLLLAVAGPAAAEPLVKRSVVYYEVSGATAQEIRAAIDRLRPAEQVGGQRRDAVTRWYVKWTYRYRNVGQDCGIARAAITVEIALTLPKLKPDAARSAELTRAFEEFTRKLLVHEEGHAENGIETARRIERAILDMKPHPTCDALGRAANVLAQSLIEEGNGRDAEYDARTQHGRAQGARFP